MILLVALSIIGIAVALLCGFAYICSLPNYGIFIIFGLAFLGGLISWIYLTITNRSHNESR